jgi:zinc transport system ATP-binding protein
MLGLVPPIRGTVVRRSGLRATYVPQASAVDGLVPLQVAELTGWGALRGWSFARPWSIRDRAERARRGLRDQGVEDLARRRMAELSGGQRQRVLLARMVASDSELAILDEPTAAMDGPAATATYASLRRLARDRGQASVVVTHAAADAARHADRIVLLDPDAGGVTIGSVTDVAAVPRFRSLFGGVDIPEIRDE